MGQPERRDHANGVAPTGDALLARSDRATFMPAWRCLRHSSGFTIGLRASPNNDDRVRVTAIGLRPGRNRWGVVQPLVGPGPYDEAQRQRVPLRPRPIAVSRDPAPGEHGHLSLLRPEPPAAAASIPQRLRHKACRDRLFQTETWGRPWRAAATRRPFSSAEGAGGLSEPSLFHLWRSGERTSARCGTEPE